MRTSRRRPIAGAVVISSLAFALASCVDDDESAGQDTEGEETSTDDTEGQERTDDICPHVMNLIVAQNPTGVDLDVPDSVLERRPDELPGILGYGEFPVEDDVGAAVEGNVGGILSELFESHQWQAYEVIDADEDGVIDGDSLEIAGVIEQTNQNVEGLVAAPLLLLTMTGHWGMSPAGNPITTTDVGVTPGSLDSTAKTVAVVDTGYTKGGPSWLDDRVDGVDTAFDAEPAGLEPRYAGHGRFVSSVITQEAPNVKVRVARLAEIDPAVVPTLVPSPNPFTADELQLYIAINRLLKLGVPYSALNLSLGAYACEGLGESTVDSSGLAIRAAMDLWNASWGTGPVPPILAAAGNRATNDQSPLPPFLPAAYDVGPGDSICAVMSVDANGNPSWFSNTVPGGVRALGESLVGIGPSNNWIYWSGTSFATALMTAKAALGTGCDSITAAFTNPVNVKHGPPTPVPQTTTGPTTTTIG